DDVHHPLILMAEDVAVEDEAAGDIAAEVHLQCDARIGADAIPRRYADRVEILARDAGRRGIYSEMVLAFDQEVYLVDVEIVAFPGAVLDDPALDRPDVGDDRRRHVRVE